MFAYHAAVILVKAVFLTAGSLIALAVVTSRLFGVLDPIISELAVVTSAPNDDVFMVDLCFSLGVVSLLRDHSEQCGVPEWCMQLSLRFGVIAYSSPQLMQYSKRYLVYVVRLRF